MAHTKINTQVIPDGTIVSADLTMPITDFSSTGIDDNATETAITIDANENVEIEKQYADILFNGETGQGRITTTSGAAGGFSVTNVSGGSGVNFKNSGIVELFSSNNDAAVGSLTIDTSGNTTVNGFTSTGIDDNASATVMTVAGGSSGNNSIIQSVNSNYNAGFYGSSANFGFEISDGGVGGKTVRIKNNSTEIFAHNQVQNIIDMSNASSVTVAGFTSTGIDDNATSTAITIDGSSANQVTLKSTTSPVEVVGLLAVPTSGYNHNLQCMDSRAFNTSGNGGGIGFGYQINSFENYEVGAVIQGYKDNNTSGDVAGGLRFSTRVNNQNPYVRMTISSAGNVGIGTTNPDAPLHVKVTEGSTGTTDPIARFERFTTGDNAYLDITLNNSTNMIGFQSTGTSNGGFTFGGASTNYVTIASSGEVGIGIAPSSAFGRLRIFDDNSDIDMDANAKGQLHVDGNGYGFGVALNTDGAQLYTNSASRDLIFGVNETEVMRLTPSGMGIGTSSAVSPIISSSKTLQLNSSGNTTLSIRSIDSVNDRSAILELLSSGNGVSKSIILYGDTDTSPATASPLVIQKYHSGVRTEVGRFNTSGHLVLGDSTTAYYRLKSGATGTDGGIQWMFNTDATVFGSLTLPYDTRATTGLHLYSGYPITYTVPGNKAHQFVTGGAEAARIDADGIKFNGDTAAANALDDYEEGTWTPTTPNGSWTVNEATYTKIGRLVYVRARVTAINAASGDFGGLPFTVSGSYGAGIVGFQNHISSEVFSILVQASNLFNFRIGQTQYGLGAGKQAMFAFTYEST